MIQPRRLPAAPKDRCYDSRAFIRKLLSQVPVRSYAACLIQINILSRKALKFRRELRPRMLRGVRVIVRMATDQKAKAAYEDPGLQDEISAA